MDTKLDAYLGYGATKVAASVNQLLAGLRRTARMRVRRPVEFGSTGVSAGAGPTYVETAAKTRKGVLPALQKHPELSEAINEVIAATPKPVQGKILLSPGGGVRALEDARRQLSAQGAMSEEYISSLSSINPEVGALLRAQRDAARAPIRPSGAGAKALNAVVGAHEMAEKAVTPNIAAMTGGGHRSLRVLGNERNILRRLTGPGSDEARQLMHQARDLNGENQQFDTFLRDTFGPRAVTEYGTGSTQKLPRAMLQRIGRTYRTQAEAAASKLYGL
jgi:hypothetical protein